MESKSICMICDEARPIGVIGRITIRIERLIGITYIDEPCAAHRGA